MEQFKQFNIEGLEKQWSMPPKYAKNKPEYRYLFKDTKEKSSFKKGNVDDVTGDPAMSSCYKLGFRLGTCAGKAMKGIECDPKNEFDMPSRCKGRKDTKNGIANGIRSAY